MTTNYGHYRSLFPKAEPFRPADALLVGLAEQMFRPDDPVQGASSVPAGYTYLGQFINHDLSFERRLPGEGPIDPETVENLGTPLLDLEPLYGRGPERAPFLYTSDGAQMRDGWSTLAYGEDLPRTSPVAREPRLALIADPRNDDNLIVSQLHLAFIKFHNRVTRVIKAQDGLTGSELFQAASRSVRWHYQWMIVHDFLPRIVSDTVLQRALDRPMDGGLFPPAEPPFIPVEFSAAAFRFGHSMVRQNYMLEPWFSFPFLSTAPGQDDLRGRRERPPGTQITDWWRDFFGPEAQLARKIDTVLVEALGAIPSDPTRPTPASLPLIDLRKGSRLGLPSGQAVATAMAVQEAQRLKPEHFDELTGELEMFRSQTPLWYYCLKEAEHFGHGSQLGPVGGQIVAEVLVGLLRVDPAAYLTKPMWRPEPRFGARDTTEFGIKELLAFAGSETS